MDAQITGGRVSYERRIKTGDFEGKNAVVDLSFSVPEGENYEGIFEKTMALAVSKAHHILGIKASTAPVAAGVTDKDRMAAEVVAQADPPAAAGKGKGAKKPPTPPASDPAAMDVVVEQPADAAKAVDPKPADPAAVVDEFASIAPEVTDEALTSAMTRINAKIKNPVAIRQLVGKYTPQDGNPHQAREIEQAKRAAFLTELDALKPAA